MANVPARAYCGAVPLDPRIRVFRSPIHGYGVKARRDLVAGELIADVEGILYTEADLGDDRYCLWVCDGYYFDMVDQTCWINHSCNPNAEIEADLDGEGGAWARVVAARSIAAGEEITYDYAFPEHLAERCSCGAPECRGWIVDADELVDVLKRVAAESAATGDTSAQATSASPASGPAWHPQSRLRGTPA